MEREQRSEGLLRDFIRANCQRMKHELAKRDCGLGQSRRDPGAAAAVILLQLHSVCVKRTHTITHTHTRAQLPGDPLLTDTQSVTIDQPKVGELGGWKHRCQGKRERTPPLTINPNIKPGHLKNSQQKVCVCLCVSVHVPPSLHVCFNCIHFSYRLGKKKQMIFFYCLRAISYTPSPTIVRT